MATFPTTLPQPLISGYKINPKDQTVRTDMDTGTARVRRQTTDRGDHVTVKWLVTDAQLDTFRTWFDGTTASDAQGGAAWFTITLNLGNTGQESASARFAGPYIVEPATSTDMWYISARLEVL